MHSIHDHKSVHWHLAELVSVYTGLAVRVLPRKASMRSHKPLMHTQHLLYVVDMLIGEAHPFDLRPIVYFLQRVIKPFIHNLLTNGISLLQSHSNMYFYVHSE